MNPHEYEADIAWATTEGHHVLTGIGRLIRHQVDALKWPHLRSSPKGIPGIWSPEHLFTASVSSCLDHVSGHR